MDNQYYNPYIEPEKSPVEETKVKKSGGAKRVFKVIGLVLALILVVGGTSAATTGVVIHLMDAESGLNAGNGDTQKPDDGNHQGGNQIENGNNTNNGNDDQNEGGNYAPIPDTDLGTHSPIIMMDVSELVENAMPCIVAITNVSETVVSGMWGQPYVEESISRGTGFLVEQDGQYVYIATNNHVVADAKELTIQFADGTESNATIKGQVASKDLAVVKVALKDIPEETRNKIRIATIGDSNTLRVGEGAIAIGNALGYGQSVTTGVVSALGRSVTVTDSSTGITIVNNNLIQTDAAINPGNSGGALFNAKGEVIGINSVKYADTDVEGIGYAIPISDAMIIIEKLIDGTQIDTAKAGYLGIQGMDSDYGVYIHKVFAGSAAEKAGLRVGDIIIGFEGNTISTMNQLKELLSYYAAGEEVEFVILKANGNDYVEKKVRVELGDQSTIQ